MKFDNLDFKTIEKGYDKSQVDSVLDDFLSRIAQYEEILFKKDSELKKIKDDSGIDHWEQKQHDFVVTSTIKEAVDTAKKIEQKCKQSYESEIANIKTLSVQLKNLIKSIIEKNKEYSNPEKIYIKLKDIDEKINSYIDKSKKEINDSKKATNNEYRSDVQRLLKKMGSKRHSGRDVLENQTNIFEQNPKGSEKTDINNQDYPKQKKKNQSNAHSKNQIKNITKLTLSGNDKYDNLADKYLNVRDDDAEKFSKNAYAKQLIKKELKKESSSFDLKEALSPTEDLEEIMKVFSTNEDDLD